MSAQHFENLLLLSTQPPDSFQNWQVSFTRPVMLKTLPSPHPNPTIRSYAPRERVDQGGLAGADRAADPDPKRAVL